jgi:hypothetical protein
MTIGRFLKEIHRCCYIWEMKFIVHIVGVHSAADIGRCTSYHGDMVWKRAIEEETWKKEWA